MRYWIGTICAASLLLLLPACEQPPPPQPPQPKPPVAKVAPPSASQSEPKAPVTPPASQDERAGREYSANLMTMASYVGGLIACVNADHHRSAVTEDSYYRLRNLVHLARSTGNPDLIQVFDVSYLLYLKTVETGVVFDVTVPQVDNPEAKFKVTQTIIIAGKAECLTIEAKVLEWRKKGGMLDVAPYGPAAKGDTL